MFLWRAYVRHCNFAISQFFFRFIPLQLFSGLFFKCQYRGGAFIYFCWHVLARLVPLEERVTADQYKVLLTDCVYLLRKPFYPGGCGLFQDDSAPLHRTRRLNEWLDEDEDDINPMLQPSRSSNLHQVEHGWRFGQTSRTTFSKHQLKEYFRRMGLFVGCFFSSVSIYLFIFHSSYCCYTVFYDTANLWPTPKLCFKSINKTHKAITSIFSSSFFLYTQ